MLQLGFQVQDLVLLTLFVEFLLLNFLWDHKQSGILLDNVVLERNVIVEIPALANQADIFHWNTFFLLDHVFDIFYDIIRLYLQNDARSVVRLNENLHMFSNDL